MSARISRPRPTSSPSPRTSTPPPRRPPHALRPPAGRPSAARWCVPPGRPFVDAGLSENLPLRPLLDRPDEALILACDLYNPVGALRQTMDGIADRAQELAFGCQSRHLLAALDLSGRQVRHIILSDPEDDFAGKAFDYSRASLRRRLHLGESQMAQALDAMLSDNPT